MTAAAASPHRAVLHPTEEVFLPDTLGPPRLTLHSGMVGAKAFVAKLPAPVPRPRVLRPKLRACDARCRGRVCGQRRPHSGVLAVTAMTQGRRRRIVVEPSSCSGMRIRVQADGKTQVLRGNLLEDNEVLEVAREAGCGI
jgi:hypothetical protein